MKKSVMLMVGILAIAFAGAAQAATMFAVQDSGANDKMIVTDTGAIGVGTSTPQAPMHVNLPDVSAIPVAQPVGTVLYNSSTGFAVTRQDGSSSADFTVADGTAAPGKRGMIRGVRARGTLAAPTVPLLNDQVVSVLGAAWTGQRVQNAADISVYIDGPVTDGGTAATAAAPMRISLSTRPLGTTWFERLTVKADGKVGINTTAPTSQLQVVGLPVFGSNALAISGGLTAGAFYTDGAGNLKIVF